MGMSVWPLGMGKGVVVVSIYSNMYMPAIFSFSMKTYRHKSYLESDQIWDNYFLSMSLLDFTLEGDGHYHILDFTLPKKEVS